MPQPQIQNLRAYVNKTFIRGRTAKIRADEINETVNAVLDQVESRAAWQPVLASIPHEGGVIFQVYDWIGAAENLNPKPPTGAYLGEAGLVATKALASLLRGLPGVAGSKGWSPVFGAVPGLPLNGNPTRVLKLISYQGGEGPVPAVVGDLYVQGTGTGYTNDIAYAMNIMGAKGGNGVDWRMGTDVPTGGNQPIRLDGVPDLYLHTTTGDVYKQVVPSGRWDLVGNLRGLKGTDGTNGTNGKDGVGIDGKDGAAGAKGWAPVFSVVAGLPLNGQPQRVLKLVGFQGGEGTKPTIVGDQYLQSTGNGYTSDIAYAANIMGAKGVDGVNWRTGTDVPNGGSQPLRSDAVSDFYLQTTTGDLYRQNVPSGSWAFIGNLRGPAGANGTGGGGTSSNFTDEEKTKLAGIAPGATANRTDSELLNRANHTGTQAASTVTEDATHRFFTDAERTKLGTINAYATVNSTDATLKNRANHTGTQDASTINEDATHRFFTDTERTKLDGINAGATVNSTDAVLKDRANHTGTQAASTINQDATHRFVTDTQIANWNNNTGGGGSPAPSGGSYFDTVTPTSAAELNAAIANCTKPVLLVLGDTLDISETIVVENKRKLKIIAYGLDVKLTQWNYGTQGIMVDFRGTLKDIVIDGFRFNCPLPSSAGDGGGYGQLIARGAVCPLIEGMLIQNCEFTTPDLHQNAMSFISVGWGGYGIRKNVTIRNCKGRKIKRMFAEITNQEEYNTDGTPRYNNFLIEDCQAWDLGNAGSNSSGGMMVSFDGPGFDNEVIGCRVTNPYFAAYEAVGTSGVKFINNYADYTIGYMAPFVGYSFTDGQHGASFGPKSVTVEGGRVRCTGRGFNLTYAKKCTFDHVSFISRAGNTLVNAEDNEFRDCAVVGVATNSALIGLDQNTRRNLFAHCYFGNEKSEDASGGRCTIVLFSSGCTDNQFLYIDHYQEKRTSMNDWYEATYLNFSSNSTNQVLYNRSNNPNPGF